MAATAGAGPAPPADLLAIQHEPVHCLVAGKYPELDACFDPSSRVARARVYFRGEGASDWYYVEMKAEAPCFRGVLPRPKKSLKSVSYYVAVTDRDFAEARTQEYATQVVADGKSCADGVAAPFLASASVLVGGASALPAGFVGGGILAGVGTTAVVAGAAVVGAGAAGVVIAVGGGEESPPSTTQPPAPSTTTTTTPTTPTTTTTTTTTLPGCAADSAPPEVRILSPGDNDDVGARIDIVAEARDPGPASSGIREVRISAEEQGGSRSASITTLPGPGPTFRASWTLPPCLGPQDRWYLSVEAVDGCGRATLERVRVKRRSDTCFAGTSSPAAAAEGQALAWTSELAVPGGRGQVISNGSFVLFPGPGRSDLLLPTRRGRNRLEALLVEGGSGGTWRLSLASGEIRPGSLRVLAGEVAAAGPLSVVFRLQGRPGERVVLGFDAE
ncbi:MAG TPA: hypothetical protein VE359_13340 [Vicinamibacteria bacterium]|nr:hypothetical protein [Vicinamibacteria bacterium]